MIAARATKALRRAFGGHPRVELRTRRELVLADGAPRMTWAARVYMHGYTSDLQLPAGYGEADNEEAAARAAIADVKLACSWAIESI